MVRRRRRRMMMVMMMMMMMMMMTLSPGRRLLGQVLEVIEREEPPLLKAGVLGGDWSREVLA
jgi:hypothetical protein